MTDPSPPDTVQDLTIRQLLAAKDEVIGFLQAALCCEDETDLVIGNLEVDFANTGPRHGETGPPSSPTPLDLPDRDRQLAVAIATTDSGYQAIQSAIHTLASGLYHLERCTARMTRTDMSTFAVWERAHARARRDDPDRHDPLAGLDPDSADFPDLYGEGDSGSRSLLARLRLAWRIVLNRR